MYYLLYAVLWLVSLLPLRVLYVLSDGISFLVYHVFGYRRNVVLANLDLAFPEKTKSEKRKIARRFYRNLVDTFLETIKMITMPVRKIEKRVTINFDAMQETLASGKRVQIHLGHNFNWEWANAVAARQFQLPVIAVYMPISNKAVDRLFYRLRSRNGTILVRAHHMKEDFLPYRGTRYILGLVADQNPSWPPGALWFHFLGKPAPFVRGPAKHAIANDTAVIFGYIHKPRRGHYDLVLTRATLEPGQMTEEQLTEKFVHYLEQVIRQYPEMWLWSHRRWRHDWKPEYGPVIS